MSTLLSNLFQHPLYVPIVNSIFTSIIKNVSKCNKNRKVTETNKIEQFKFPKQRLFSYDHYHSYLILTIFHVLPLLSSHFLLSKIYIFYYFICTITISHIRIVLEVQSLAEILRKANIKNLEVLYVKELKPNKAQGNRTTKWAKTKINCLTQK